MNAAADEVLRAVLEGARTAGFLGPGPVEPHLRHARGFGEAVEDALERSPANFADLGSGGGIPGLVLALRWPDSHGALVDSARRRCAALREAVDRLALDPRIEVVEDRGEAVGRAEEFRERFDVVTARSFAEPPVTAEIGAGLVGAGGILVVSEPPEVDDARWPVAGLAEVGFAPAVHARFADSHFVVIRKVGPVPDRYPRPVGRPGKRPLW